MRRWPTQIEEQLVRWPVALDVEELAAAFVLVCDSPLGPLAAGTTLRGRSRSASGSGRSTSSFRWPAVTIVGTAADASQAR